MKRKNLFLVMLFLIGAVSMNAQVRIGGTKAPDPSSILDLNADSATVSNKGFVLPRVALSATNNITSPIAKPWVGMHVYNSVIYGKGVGSYCSPYHRLS
jgi:hypothetical protein